MDEDEQRAKRIATYVIGQQTDEMSVDEVSETITALKTEITRLEKIKSEKSTHLSAAAALFKS